MIWNSTICLLSSCLYPSSLSLFSAESISSIFVGSQDSANTGLHESQNLSRLRTRIPDGKLPVSGKEGKADAYYRERRSWLIHKQLVWNSIHSLPNSKTTAEVDCCINLILCSYSTCLEDQVNYALTRSNSSLLVWNFLFKTQRPQVVGKELWII